MVYRDCCVPLPRGVIGLSAVCDCGIPDHTHLFHFFIKPYCTGLNVYNYKKFTKYETCANRTVFIYLHRFLIL